MPLVAMGYTLFAILVLILCSESTYLRSASRWSRSLAARRSTGDCPAPAMGMSRSQHRDHNRAGAFNNADVDRVALDHNAGSVAGFSSSSALSSSSPPTTTSTITTDFTFTVTSTITVTQAFPTGRYASEPQWLPHGSSIDVREFASPDAPHRYNSSGDCGEYFRQK
jgi:hypothetical protein